MEISKIDVRIEGISPLLQHRFPMDEVDVKSKAKNQKQTQDDVESYLYRENGLVVQPSTHIIGALKKGGAKFQITGQGKLTYKNLMGSGVVTISPANIPHVHQEFKIDRRPVVIQSSRIVRSRPIFDPWALEFTLEFDEEEVPKDVLKQIFDYAGRFVGIGDFRPSCGGPFGRFMVTRFV